MILTSQYETFHDAIRLKQESKSNTDRVLHNHFFITIYLTLNSKTSCPIGSKFLFSQTNLDLAQEPLLPTLDLSKPADCSPVIFSHKNL